MRLSFTEPSVFPLVIFLYIEAVHEFSAVFWDNGYRGKLIDSVRRKVEEKLNSNAVKESTKMNETKFIYWNLSYSEE